MSAVACVVLAAVEPPRRLTEQRAAARAALVLAADALGARTLELAHDERGAPRLTGGPVGWHASLAHTPMLAAAALARTAVGVDVEDWTRPRVERLLAVFDGAELALLGSAEPLELARLWTAKEAVLKLAGVGLAELSHCRLRARGPAGELVMAHRDRTCAVRHRVHGDHVAAFCSGQPLEVEWRTLEPARAP